MYSMGKGQQGLFAASHHYRWRWLWLVVVLAGLPADRRAATAQRLPLFLVRYEGVATVGTRPAPAGATITAFTATSPDDLFVCGRTTVGAGGGFQLDIVARPECAPARHPSPTIPHIFVLNGEQVGAAAAESRFLTYDEPRGWGRTVRRDLRGTDVPGGPPAAEDRFLPGVRFYGTLRIGNRPASTGTVVRALHIRAVDDLVECGNGEVRDRQGGYLVDIPITPDCLPARNPEPTVTIIFVVNGEKTGSYGVESRHTTLDQPGSWARAIRRDLSGTDIPGVEGTSGARPPAMRYYGNVTIDNRPAPRGTAVTVLAAAGTASGPVCGSGSTQDNQGSYFVDIVLIPACIPARHDSLSIPHSFIVTGRRANGYSAEGRNLALVTPVSWGETIRRDLRVDATTPTAAASGRTETAPPELVSLATGPALPDLPVPLLPGGISESEPPPGAPPPEPPGPLPPPTAGPSAQPEPSPPGSPENPAAPGPRPPLSGGVEYDEPVPARVQLDHPSVEFEATVADCFRTLRRIQHLPTATPIRELLAFLDSPAAINPYQVVISEDNLLWLTRGALGTTTRQSEGGASDALIRIDPTGAHFEALLGKLSALFGGPAGPPDLCSVIVHELVHAADFMNDTLPDGICHLPDGDLDRAEIKAMAAGNSYALSTGHPPTTFYAVDGFPLPKAITLPESAIAPTAESWQQYQRGNICP